ncbi:MAG: RHS repeat-associated core domain-containing protein, partial [Actinobacteria bacterium]|nr:RHS repeat-associated core domain-containing protein [Actinomycetota bacterium]
MQRGFDGTLTYTTTNHQGSIVATLDNNGDTTQLEYTPYGALRTGQPTNDRAFLGKHTDTTTGLNYLNNRYQQPELGVFLSVDPMAVVTGEPYIYGGANPIRFSDPTGLFVCADGIRHVSDANPEHCDSVGFRMMNRSLETIKSG